VAITLDQYKQHMPGLEGAGEDVNLTTFLAQAESLIAGGCGWARTDAGTLTLAAAAYTVQIDGPSALDPGKLYLPVAWVASVSEVVVDSGWDFSSPAYTLVEGTDYILDQRAHSLRLKPGGKLSAWPEGAQTRVTFSGGWAAYPDEVVAVIAWQARHMWHSRPNNTVGSFSADGQSVTKREAAAVPKQVKSMAATAGLVVWGHRAA